MGLHPFDWILALVLILGLALWARRERNRITHAAHATRAQARIAGYRRLLVVQWSLVGLLTLHWWSRSRPVTGLGLSTPLDWRFLLAWLLALAGVAVLWKQLRGVQLHEDHRAAARKELRALEWLLPHSRSELTMFLRVSVTAGICEEVLYRGFLVWFLTHWMPLWVAFLVAGALFGLAHLYQGPAGVLKTGVIGIAFGALTLLAGSILPAMLLHVAVDALNGRLAYVALTTPRPAPEPVDGA